MIIKEETQKLLNVGHITKIQYPEWLAKVVLVQKVNGKWRMCADFIDLNKACPKDSYPLSSINSLLESASSCRLLSFLDAFSGYNQIRMHPRDESKTAFRIELSSYCYKVMPFGLKNVGWLFGFEGDQVEVRGHVELRTTFLDGTSARTINNRYIVVMLSRPTICFWEDPL